MQDTFLTFQTSRTTRSGSIKPIEKAIHPMTNILNKTRYVLATVATVAALPFAASAQEACTVYSVKQGDTLALIAQQAYGTFDYQTIFNANRNLISNPTEVEIGIALQLPCEDGSLPGAGSAQELIASQEAEQQTRPRTSNAFEPPIKIVTGNGWKPFVGEEFNGGGMFVRLATTALNRGGNAREHKVSFVDDWDSHLDTLLPLGAMDISIAWSIPDCTKIDLLSDRMARRCTELDSSLPIYESVFGFYTLTGNDYESASSMDALAGARVCRPEGWQTFDLEQAGLVEPVITMSAPKSVADCMNQLLAGEVDVFTLDVETVAAAAAEADAQDKIAQNPFLTSLLAMRFVTHKTNPRGRVYLALLNRGLTEMRESGEWYAIISDSLAEFNKLEN